MTTDRLQIEADAVHYLVLDFQASRQRTDAGWPENTARIRQALDEHNAERARLSVEANGHLKRLVMFVTQPTYDLASRYVESSERTSESSGATDLFAELVDAIRAELSLPAW